jgi:hypothetical protein
MTQTSFLQLDKKRQDTKLAADLQRVLNDFSKAQRDALDREKKYIPYMAKETQDPNRYVLVSGCSSSMFKMEE